MLDQRVQPVIYMQPGAAITTNYSDRRLHHQRAWFSKDPVQWNIHPKPFVKRALAKGFKRHIGPRGPSSKSPSIAGHTIDRQRCPFVTCQILSDIKLTIETATKIIIGADMSGKHVIGPEAKPRIKITLTHFVQLNAKTPVLGGRLPQIFG